jgi:lysozyme family protein
MVDFESSFQYVMKNEGEGKYTYRLTDSGGPTKYGVSLKFYRELKGQAYNADVIQDLTEDQARDICLSQFWVPLRCALSDNHGVATAILDMGYLEGIRTAGLVTQIVLKRLGATVKLDGILGSISWSLINSLDPALFIHTLVDAQLAHFKTLVQLRPNDADNLNGWFNRTNRLLTLIS